MDAEGAVLLQAYVIKTSMILATQQGGKHVAEMQQCPLTSDLASGIL